MNKPVHVENAPQRNHKERPSTGTAPGREKSAFPGNKRVVLIMPYGIENRGIRYLASVLRRRGFDPYLVFFERWVNNRIEPPSSRDIGLLGGLVKDINPLFAGFGVGAPYARIVGDLTRRVRDTAGVPILWGGVYPTVQPEVCIETADFVCIGEGEHPVCDLAGALSGDGDAVGIPNIWSRQDGKVNRNKPRPLIRDLDSIPFPSYRAQSTSFIENGRISLRDPIIDTAEYRIYPTRGCPYSCGYCQNSALRKITADAGGPYYRRRSVVNVIGELEAARELLPKIRRVKFDGDVFAFPNEWIDEFAKKYRRRIGIPFELLTYPGELDLGELKKLRSAGLVKIQTGIQSGSDREVRDSYGRRSTAAGIGELSKLAGQAGVEVVYDVIFDNPAAASADKRALVELLLSLERPFKLYLYSLTLFPGTPLAEELLAKGIVTPDDIEGRAAKSFTQFRLSFDYPRSREEIFWISLTILASKRFVPRPLVRKLIGSRLLKAHPGPLKAIAVASDFARSVFIAAGMARRGELTLFKLRQYGLRGRLITQ